MWLCSSRCNRRRDCARNVGREPRECFTGSTAAVQGPLAREVDGNDVRCCAEQLEMQKEQSTKQVGERHGCAPLGESSDEEKKEKEPKRDSRLSKPLVYFSLPTSSLFCLLSLR